MNLNLRTISCDPDRLESFLSGELSDAEERELTLHLNSCEHCRRTLEQQAAEPGAWQEAENLLKPSGFDSHGIDENSDSGFLKCPTRQPLQIQSVLDALKPTDDPEMLGRVGGYEVSGVVGAGGMGVVLKAIDKSLDRTVAIKVMAPHLASRGAARKRFAREAKAAAAVLHPNVIAIHSVSNDESLPYLVMPYMRGTSLQKRLDREGPLSLNEILRIGSQIAAGLAAAHAQGLVHRDIKPANILLEDGVERVTITDFGLARAVDDATITHSGVIAGTPQYMSPEQARGEAVEQRSDLFSLGSVLYALCTGRAPFRAESTYGVLRRIIDEEPKPIRELNPEIPEWLCRIVARLMSKQPNNRFESAQEVARLLEECLAHIQQPNFVPLPAAVETQSNGHRFIFNAPRRRIFAMVAAFGLTLLGMILLQASAPPDISGQWTGAEWGNVFLEGKQSGEYFGTYTDTFGGNLGTLHVKWSRLEHRFNGTWQEGNDRNGKISVRLVDGQIRGAWRTSKESEINAGIPDMADLLWVRQNESEMADEGRVVAINDGEQVEISIGHDDGLKNGMKLLVYHGKELRGILEVTTVGAGRSNARIVTLNEVNVPIELGDTIQVPTFSAPKTFAPKTSSIQKAGKSDKSSDVEAPQRRFEVCAASELAANEAAVLEKEETGREILYLNSSDGKVILLRRNPETLLDETDLLSAAAMPDPDLQDSYSINLELSAEAAERFGRETLRLSKQNPSVRLAVLVPGRVLMAPYLRAAIPGGKIRITGNFTKQEAERLASELHGAEDSTPGADVSKSSETSGIRVQLLLDVVTHSHEMMTENLQYDGLSLMATGVKGTIHGKPLDDLVAVLAHECRLESFEPADYRGGKYWKATFFVPQGLTNDGSNHTLTQETLDQMQQNGTKYKLDHFRGQPEKSPDSHLGR